MQWFRRNEEHTAWLVLRFSGKRSSSDTSSVPSVSSDDPDTKSIRDGSSIGRGTTTLPIRFNPIVLLGNPLEKMLRGERRLSVFNEPVEVGIVPQQQAGHVPPGQGTSDAQWPGGVCPVHADVHHRHAQGRNADDQIVFPLRVTRRCPGSDTRSAFISNDVMVWIVVSQTFPSSRMRLFWYCNTNREKLGFHSRSFVRSCCTWYR